jgi:hypothetical protein
MIALRRPSSPCRSSELDNGTGTISVMVSPLFGYPHRSGGVLHSFIINYGCMEVKAYLDKPTATSPKISVARQRTSGSLRGLAGLLYRNRTPTTRLDAP